jgi:hypothetical protein
MIHHRRRVAWVFGPGVALSTFCVSSSAAANVFARRTEEMARTRRWADASFALGGNTPRTCDVRPCQGRGCHLLFNDRGAVAQLVERCNRTAEVRSSNLLRSTLGNPRKSWGFFISTDIVYSSANPKNNSLCSIFDLGMRPLPSVTTTWNTWSHACERRVRRFGFASVETAASGCRRFTICVNVWILSILLSRSERGVEAVNRGMVGRGRTSLGGDEGTAATLHGDLVAGGKLAVSTLGDRQVRVIEN